MIDKSIIAINKDIRIADTMHSDFYKKIFYYNLSIKNIFQHSWQFIIKESELNESIYPFYFLEDSINEPLILTTKNNGNIHYYSHIHADKKSDAAKLSVDHYLDVTSVSSIILGSKIVRPVGPRFYQTVVDIEISK